MLLTHEQMKEMNFNIGTRIKIDAIIKELQPSGSSSDVTIGDANNDENVEYLILQPPTVEKPYPSVSTYIIFYVLCIRNIEADPLHKYSYFS